MENIVEQNLYNMLGVDYTDDAKEHNKVIGLEEDPLSEFKDPDLGPEFKIPNYSLLPEDFKANTKWMMYTAKWDSDKKKFSKSPVENTSWNEEANQYTFEKIIPNNCYGLVLTDSSPICCLDIDTHKDSEHVKKIIKFFSPTFIENSMSGNGIHIFFKLKDKEKLKRLSATLPLKEDNNIKLEFYCSKRWMAVTCDVIEKSNLKEISLEELNSFTKENCTKTYIEEEALTEKKTVQPHYTYIEKNPDGYHDRVEVMKRAKNWDKIQCTQNITQCDRSNAIESLICMVAFYLETHGNIKSYIAGTALGQAYMADGKWDRRIDADIAKGLSTVKEFWKPGKKTYSFFNYIEKDTNTKVSVSDKEEVKDSFLGFFERETEKKLVNDFEEDLLPSYFLHLWRHSSDISLGRERIAFFTPFVFLSSLLQQTVTFDLLGKENILAFRVADLAPSGFGKTPSLEANVKFYRDMFKMTNIEKRNQETLEAFISNFGKRISKKLLTGEKKPTEVVAEERLKLQATWGKTCYTLCVNDGRSWMNKICNISSQGLRGETNYAAMCNILDDSEDGFSNSTKTDGIDLIPYCGFSLLFNCVLDDWASLAESGNMIGSGLFGRILPVTSTFKLRGNPVKKCDMDIIIKLSEKIHAFKYGTKKNKRIVVDDLDFDEKNNWERSIQYDVFMEDTNLADAYRNNKEVFESIIGKAAVMAKKMSAMLAFFDFLKSYTRDELEQMQIMKQNIQARKYYKTCFQICITCFQPFLETTLSTYTSVTNKILKYIENKTVEFISKKGNIKNLTKTGLQQNVRLPDVPGFLRKTDLLNTFIIQQCEAGNIEEIVIGGKMKIYILSKYKKEVVEKL